MTINWMEMKTACQMTSNRQPLSAACGTSCFTSKASNFLTDGSIKLLSRCNWALQLPQHFFHFSLVTNLILMSGSYRRHSWFSRRMHCALVWRKQWHRKGSPEIALTYSSPVHVNEKKKHCSLLHHKLRRSAHMTRAVCQRVHYLSYARYLQGKEHISSITPNLGSVGVA